MALQTIYPALITCLALLVYVWTILGVGQARGKYGVKAPAITGDPIFERHFRVQQNTLELLVLFLPSLWIFSRTVSPLWGLILGAVFVVGRVIYGVGYIRDPERRGPGFLLSGLSSVILLLGGLIGTVMQLVVSVG